MPIICKLREGKGTLRILPSRRGWRKLEQWELWTEVGFRKENVHWINIKRARNSNVTHTFSSV